MAIAILEDDEQRVAAMRGWLEDRLYMYEHQIFSRADRMIEWLADQLKRVAVISLDHDLEPIDAISRLETDNPGTGRIVAEYLAMKAPQCPVVLHSTNRPAVQGMRQVLEDADWKVDTVLPYGDLAWVSELWWPQIKNSINNRAVRLIPANDDSNEITGARTLDDSQVLEILSLANGKRKIHELELLLQEVDMISFADERMKNVKQELEQMIKRATAEITKQSA
jgi:hypothetical protein